MPTSVVEPAATVQLNPGDVAFQAPLCPPFQKKLVVAAAVPAREKLIVLPAVPFAAPSSVTSVKMAASVPVAPAVGVKEICKFADCDFVSVVPAVRPESENIDEPAPESVAEMTSRFVSAQDWRPS